MSALASSLTWPSAFAAGAAFGPAVPTLVRPQDDSRDDGADGKHLVQSLHTTPEKENAGCSRRLFSSFFEAPNASSVFLHSELSEMTAKTSETAQKPSEFTREEDRQKVRAAVRYLANPVNPGENIGAQILKVYRILVREGLKDIKFSRVRDFWHGDKRMSVRGFERKAIEGIAARHKLKLEIAGHARAAGEFSHEATASAARVEDRLRARGLDGEGRQAAGGLGEQAGR